MRVALFTIFMSFPIAGLALRASPVLADDKQEAAVEQKLAEVNQWVVDLNANRFMTRELATERLLKAGDAAIEPLVLALPGGNREMVYRGIHVLRELALAEDESTSKLARSGLEQLASLPKGPLSQSAGETLAQLDAIRQDRAILVLRQKGAKIYSEHVQVNQAFIPNVLTVEIDDDWSGDATDLAQLRWLHNARQLTLLGSKITDEYLSHAARMPSLAIVTIKRAKISDEAMFRLKAVDNLQSLTVMYCPLTNASVEHLKVHRRAMMVKLFGTRITTEAAQQLAVAIPNGTIDHRNGAFLGVGCEPQANGCAVAIVHPNSAAAKAGIQIGDVIMKYNGQPAVDFPTLTKLIGKNHPGEKAKLDILRNGDPKVVEIELGEWD